MHHPRKTAVFWIAFLFVASLLVLVVISNPSRVPATHSHFHAGEALYVTITPDRIDVEIATPAFFALVANSAPFLILLGLWFFAFNRLRQRGAGSNSPPGPA